MSDLFVSQLRARTSTIRLTPTGTSSTVTIRVEMPEVWDAVRIVASAREPLLTIKVRALEALFPEAEMHSDFVMKFRGWDILDEASPLSELGIDDGAILLLTHRRRRPVRSALAPGTQPLGALPCLSRSSPTPTAGVTTRAGDTRSMSAGCGRSRARSANDLNSFMSYCTSRDGTRTVTSSPSPTTRITSTACTP